MKELIVISARCTSTWVAPTTRSLCCAQPGSAAVAQPEAVVVADDGVVVWCCWRNQFQSRFPALVWCDCVWLQLLALMKYSRTKWSSSSWDTAALSRKTTIFKVIIQQTTNSWTDSQRETKVAPWFSKIQCRLQIKLINCPIKRNHIGSQQ